MSKASQREVFWMTCAMINARDRADAFAALVELVRSWPERPLCALADSLVPTPGIAKDRESALEALQQFSQGIPRDVAARLRTVGAEIAEISGAFRARPVI